MTGCHGRLIDDVNCLQCTVFQSYKTKVENQLAVAFNIGYIVVCLNFKQRINILIEACKSVYKLMNGARRVTAYVVQNFCCSSGGGMER